MYFLTKYFKNKIIIAVIYSVILAGNCFAQSNNPISYSLLEGTWERIYYENNEEYKEQIVIDNRTLTWFVNDSLIMRSRFILSLRSIVLLEDEIYDIRRDRFITLDELKNEFYEYMNQIEHSLTKTEIEMLYLRLVYPYYNFIFRGINDIKIETTDKTYLMVHNSRLHQDSEYYIYQKIR
jgi:hypothetical protein